MDRKQDKREVIAAFGELALLYLSGGMYKQAQRCIDQAFELDRARYCGIIESRYNDDQPRDEQGRWTSGGGSSSAGSKNELDFGNKNQIVDDVLDSDSQDNINNSGKDDKDALISKIKEMGIAGSSYNIPPKVCDIEELSVDIEHIKSRKHDVTMSEAKSFVKEADISITRWNGKFENYYSSKGASYVNTESKTVRTAFKSSEYDDKTKKMMGEIKKWKKRE